MTTKTPNVAINNIEIQLGDTTWYYTSSNDSWYAENPHFDQAGQIQAALDLLLTNYNELMNYIVKQNELDNEPDFEIPAHHWTDEEAEARYWRGAHYGDTYTGRNDPH